MINFVTGCEADDNLSTEEKVEQMFASPYSAVCTATVKSNKTENNYSYSCKRLEDGTYIVDYGSLVLTVGAESANLSGDFGDINATASDADLALIPTYFFENYLKGGQMAETDAGYLLLCDISHHTKYRATAKMELDKNVIPLQMIIEDIDGNNLITVDIKEFKR